MEKTFPIRLSAEILNRIERVSGYRPKKSWIEEAIMEKLKKEEREKMQNESV